MLSPEHRAIVKATVPLLESGGEALTTHFYRIMLSEHPEVRPLFNQAHQASGDQPRALANGVLMYAKHIDRLEALGPLVGQIVQKHVSLQVLPEHYPVVGSCLLRAIREVLGAEVATDAVIEAWGAAYGMLADLLIGAEESVYAGHAQADGGWRGARAFRVERRVRESDEITSFHLAPVDGGPVLRHAPGEYIGLRLVIDGQEMRRNYSLSAAANGRDYRISVKREAGGRVSGHLHEAVKEGDVLDLFPPAGDFTLQASERPVALITAGVGITPALPMMEQALADGREVHFIHCARHGGVHAFREQVEALAQRYPKLKRFYVYSEPRTGDQAHAEGFIERLHLERWLPQPAAVDAYFLGPKPFMKRVKALLAEVGVPAERTRYEFFGPAAALEG